MAVRVGRLPEKVNILTVLEYLLMGLVVFYTATWCLFTSANCNTAIRLALPLLVVMIFLRAGVVKAAHWHRVVLLAVFLAVYLVATRYNAVRFVLYYAVPLLLLVLYVGLKERQEGCLDLLHKLSDVVMVLTALSLFFYLFGTVLNLIPGETTATYSWGGTVRTCPTYFHLFYEAQKINFFGLNLVRNCGVFPEAPGFAIFLVLATATEVLLRDKPRLWRCLLYVAATVTTYSAKAIVLVAAVFALKYVFTPTEGGFSRKFKAIAVPTALVGVGAVAAVLLWDKMQTVSGFMRLDDVLACFKTWLTAPVFGTGYWNDESVIPFFAYPDRYNNGLSMGVMVVLAQGGLYLLTLYAVPAVRAILRARGQTRWMLGAFVLMMFALLFTSNIAYNFLTLLLIALFLEYGAHGEKESLTP